MFNSKWKLVGLAGATLIVIAGTGCDMSLSLGDAVSAGVFDFVSGSITDLLNSLNPLNAGG